MPTQLSEAWLYGRDDSPRTCTPITLVARLYSLSVKPEELTRHTLPGAPLLLPSHPASPSLSPLCPVGWAGGWPAHSPLGPEAPQRQCPPPTPTPVSAQVQHIVIIQSVLIEMSRVDLKLLPRLTRMLPLLPGSLPFLCVGNFSAAYSFLPSDVI